MSNIFADISDGLYDDMLSEDNDLVLEAYYPDNIEKNKTLRKQIYLPQGSPIGRGNACLLYTNSLEQSISIINNKVNFINRGKYKYYYYDRKIVGTLYHKKYRIIDYDRQKAIYEKIKSETGLVGKKVINVSSNDNRNIYVDLHKYLDIFNSICSNLTIVRYMETYWEYMNRILNQVLLGYTNRFVLVNMDYFDIKATVKDNLSNPLYMIYYTIYRKRLDLLKNINIDFYFYQDKKEIIINPSELTVEDVKKIKVEMTKLINNPTKASIINKALDDNELDKTTIEDDVTNTIVSDLSSNNDYYDTSVNIKPITTNKELKADDAKVKLNQSLSPSTVQDISDTVKKVTDETLDAAPDADVGDVQKSVEIKVKEELDNDHEAITKIYRQMVVDDAKKSVASTERDNLLKKKQQEIFMKTMTVGELEKINSIKTTVPSKDISNALTTTNDNMKTVRFDNFEKAYNETLMEKDITAAIMALSDKSIPLYILSVDIKDTSNELNYKDTYTIHFEDGNRKRHTIKVDIPKFIDDKFLYLGGNKKIIKYQNFFYPVVKLKEDTVQIVTNYNKMIIQRKENKSFNSVERLKKLIITYPDIKDRFTFANVAINNKKYITTLEYDEVSKYISQYKVNNKTMLMFDQEEAQIYANKRGFTLYDEKMFIGVINDKPIYINIDAQTDEDNKSIIQLMIDTFPDEAKDKYMAIRAPKRLMYAKVTVMEKNVSVGLLLGIWEGLSSVMKKLNLKYRLENKIPTDLKPNESFMKFSDCVLVYEDSVPISLIMNGFRLIDTTKYSIISFDTSEPYIPYIIKVYGKSTIENALSNVYEFMIDPITKDILIELGEPTDLVSLIIYAVSLLADSQYINEINQGLSRIRSNEIIPAILYERLAKNYIMYRNSNGRKKFSVKQDCVIAEVLKQKTVEDYSTLNPSLEVHMSHAISAKGFRGVNLDDAYTVPKRSFDPSMIGVIAPSTSPDGQVGVNKTLTLEPTIKNLRGFVELHNGNLDKLKDVNLFAPDELTMPLAPTIDDPTRLGHSIKQSMHVVPVKNSSPVLITNGMDEAMRFHLSSDFVVNADESGEIVDYDEESQIMVAKYKSGKTRAISLAPFMVKNGGGGFWLSNQLVSDLKVGDKFKANDILAYHKDFFTNDKFNNCRMNMGTLAKVAIMSNYNTYEDGTCITKKFSEDAATEMCYRKGAVIGKNSNILYMAQKGMYINVGDPLIQFDTSYDDDTLNALLANLGDDDKQDIKEESRNEIRSKVTGVIEEIKVYSTVDLDELSASLKHLVSTYYRKINRKKEFLNKYDTNGENSIVKCGMLVTDTTHKIEPNKFGVIKGEQVNDSVLIEFYIKHSEPLEVGSKIANFSALKNTIGEIIPEGYEPFSEYEPSEEVSEFIASNSILNRMVPSILNVSLGNKCIIYLKRKLKEIYLE